MHPLFPYCPGTGQRRAMRHSAVRLPAVLILWRHPAPLAGTLDYAFGKILPLGPASEQIVAYSLFSGAHLRDFLQEQFLLGPFGALFVLVILALGAHGRTAAGH